MNIFKQGFTRGFFCCLLALAVVLVPVSKAFASPPAIDGGLAFVEKVPIKDGKFTATARTNVPGPHDGAPGKPIRIEQALVSLSPDSLKEGVVRSIKITGPKGVEFGCVNLKVQDGTDLIKSCGGPALLEPGDTLYEASGDDFGPDGFGEFSIILIPS
jgi:hypothetical protein